MSRLFESIMVVDGVARHLALHSARMNRSRGELFGPVPAINLEEVLPALLRSASGLCKCRVEYDREIRTVECTPYQQRRISGLMLVHDDEIRYDHKYLDRAALEKFSGVDETEEVVIVRKGFVTDTRYSNIVLVDGHLRVTPAYPLLRGIQREYLLSIDAIREEEVRAEDLRRFDRVILINAMMDLETGPVIDRARIRAAGEKSGWQQ
jgi:4-amino-4-deoxychorismate lyase